jgi:hypothetical protein
MRQESSSYLDGSEDVCVELRQEVFVSAAIGSIMHQKELFESKHILEIFKVPVKT